jgi:predicted RNase H-like nuclease
MSGPFGVDGCRGGWIAASRTRDGAVTVQRIGSLGELGAPQVIAIDIPIGLADAGNRECDRLARTRLGARRSSVFAAPIRPMLAASSHAEACTIGRTAPGNDGKAIALQAWNIVPKIREIDALLGDQPELRSVVHEVHPELIFTELSRGAPFPKKKLLDGRQARLALLTQALNSTVHDTIANRRALECSADDIVDAIAALWTAERISRGEAICIPPNPPFDSTGLPMRMMI